MELCALAVSVGRHANEAAAPHRRPLAPSWKSVLSRNAGDDHRGSELSHTVPDGLIIRIMNLCLVLTRTHRHTLSVFFSFPPSYTHSPSLGCLSWAHQTKDKWEKKKSTARRTRGRFFLAMLLSSWLKMVGIFSTRLIAVCSLWTLQPWSTSQAQTGHELPQI